MSELLKKVSKKKRYPYGRPKRCTICTRMYCVWQRAGPAIVGDFVEWMGLVDNNDDRFDDIEEERKLQTVEERTRRIYERINEDIYGIRIGENVLPPECVIAAVAAMPDDLYWRMEDTMDKTFFRIVY
jgi:hypothetical protein